MAETSVRPTSRLHVGGLSALTSCVTIKAQSEKGCVIQSMSSDCICLGFIFGGTMSYKGFFFSFMFGTAVHSASRMKQLNTGSFHRPCFFFLFKWCPVRNMQGAVKDASLWAYINANMHLHHTHASCVSLLLYSIALPRGINIHKNPVGWS